MDRNRVATRGPAARFRALLATCCLRAHDRQARIDQLARLLLVAIGQIDATGGITGGHQEAAAAQVQRGGLHLAGRTGSVSALKANAPARQVGSRWVIPRSWLVALASWSPHEAVTS